MYAMLEPKPEADPAGRGSPSLLSSLPVKILAIWLKKQTKNCMWYIVVYSRIPQKKKKVWNSVDDYTVSINGILVKKRIYFHMFFCGKSHTLLVP